MWVACEDARWAPALRGALEGDGFSLVDGPRCDLAVVEHGRSLEGVEAHAIVVVLPRLAPEATVMQAYADGADQVVEEPVSARELIARLRAIARRVSPPQVADRTELVAPDGPALVVDITAGIVTVLGRKVDLTPDELVVLDVLLARRGGLVSRSELRGHLSAHARGRSLDAIVRCLRGKLEGVEGWRRLIAVRGLGFRLLLGP